MQRIAIATALLMIPASLCAQWLALPTPGIPRTADGKPNLTAPAPRMPDGKPDLSGTWQPEANPYRFNLIQQLKDESIFRPAAQAVFLARVADFRRDDPVTNCLPGGPSEMLSAAYRIMQSPAVLAVLYESPTGRYRQIYMDGRQLPDDPNPSWLGYQSAAGRATRWWSSPQDSMIGLGSTGPAILIRKSCASPRDSGASISDTCSIRSRSTIRRH